MRRHIAPKGRGHATDATNVMRGILLRQHLYAYLKQIFPKLAESIENFGTWKWFQDEYNMTETGRLEGALPNDSDEDPETPGKGLCPAGNLTHAAVRHPQCAGADTSAVCSCGHTFFR